MSNNINITLIVKANSNQEEFKKFLKESISLEEVNNSEKPIWRLSNVVKPYRDNITKNEEENHLLSWGTYEDCCDEMKISKQMDRPTLIYRLLQNSVYQSHGC